MVSVGLVLVALVLLAATQFPKKQTIQTIDLTTIPNGIYQGECNNGLDAAKVSVTVDAHRITAIDLQQHRHGKGKPAEAIIHEVIQQQSLDVDAVSGATLSSNTILKAIANALETKEEAP